MLREMKDVWCDNDYEKEKDVQKVTEYVYITKPLLKLEIIDNKGWNSFIARHGEAPLLREIVAQSFAVFTNCKLPSLKYVNAGVFGVDSQLEAPHINYTLNKKWYD